MEIFSYDLNLFKRVIRTGGITAKSSEVRVLETKLFSGVRNVKEFNNFLWHMEQYFTIAHALKEEQVTITIMYLTCDAKLWLQVRVDYDQNASLIPITSWKTLKKEVKE
ncbi:hypothetical protein CKAN_02664800 [Cinnamomum micranthum f. kanehirae]|uniref:Uncharacterized protein n=1 Tax=Cinnamomum micranthum f. kanehirae TaxID=337451 RepID=A0A3S3NZ39_9MAGN|nr:hypothetical protein CKAN_02664800 [Cinnamomum micranthum f. kanehirae]